MWVWLRRHTRALRGAPLPTHVGITQNIDFTIYFIMLRRDAKRRVSKHARPLRRLQTLKRPLVSVSRDIGQGGVERVLHPVEEHGALTGVEG